MSRKRRKPKWRLNPRKPAAWEDDIRDLTGDIYPGDTVVARVKRYGDAPITPIVAVIGALIVAAGVYMYIKNKPPSPPVG